MSSAICIWRWNEKRIKELLPWVRAQKDRFVVVLETDPVFLSQKERFPEIDVYVFSEETKLQVFEAIAWKYLFVPFSYEKNKGDLEPLIRIQTEVNYRASDYADQGAQIFKNIQHNLATDFYKGEELFGKFKGMPAFVCGAGPSLRKNGHLLKELSSKGLIIAGGGATLALKKIGVTPHFAAHVDPSSLHTFEETKVPMFFQLRSDKKAIASSKGDKLLVGASRNFPLEGWAEEQLGISAFDGGWTVGTFCASLAYHLGCSPIIFVGMDFAATSVHAYAEGVKGGGVQARQPALNKQGEVVHAQLDWMLAAQWLEKFAQKHSDSTWINATEGGLGFKGIEDKSLQELSSVLEPLLIPKPSLKHVFKGNISEVLKNSLRRSFTLLDEIFKEIERHYPRCAQGSGTCALLEHDLAEEMSYVHVLEPIWNVWKNVILRHNQDGPAGIFLHQMLFYKNLQNNLGSGQ